MANGKQSSQESWLASTTTSVSIAMALYAKWVLTRPQTWYWKM
jgi:hypothetical protein